MLLQKLCETENKKNAVTAKAMMILIAAAGGLFKINSKAELILPLLESSVRNTIKTENNAQRSSPV